MAIDEQSVRKFWESQAAKLSRLPDASVTNLEEDPRLLEMKVAREREVVFSYLSLQPGMRVLDLGAGLGVWSRRFAAEASIVDAVEYCSQLVEAAEASLQKDGVSNIRYHVCAAQDFASETPYDFIFVSGLLLYLNDEGAAALAAQLKSYSKPGTQLILRDSTGILGRHEIRDKYSDALHTHYSAVYRTRQEYLELLASAGFHCQGDQDMFPEGHPLNKFPETRLRVYSFVRHGDEVGRA